MSVITIIMEIRNEIKRYFMYLYRLWQCDYRPTSVSAFCITKCIKMENDHLYGIADTAVIRDELYILLVNNRNPDEATIKKYIDVNSENKLVDIDNHDEFYYVWEHFVCPNREKNEGLKRLLYFWKHGEVWLPNEMSCLKYIFHNYILGAGILIWFYMLNLSNIQVMHGDILLSEQQSELLFFAISALVMLITTMLSMKNNRRISYVWSNAIIAIGLALTTKLMLGFSAAVVILFTVWMILILICVYRLNKKRIKSINDNVQAVKQRWRCVILLSRHLLTAVSICFIVLFVFR